MRGATHLVCNDIILLENQVPLFVLDLLLGLQHGNPEQTGAVAGLALRFFDPLMPTDAPLVGKERTKLESSAAVAFDPLPGPMLHCRRRNTDRFSDIKLTTASTPTFAARMACGGGRRLGLCAAAEEVGANPKRDVGTSPLSACRPCPPMHQI
ncbi:hypothetical protein ACP4OV_029377 [Aristida adscensionis]